MEWNKKLLVALTDSRISIGAIMWKVITHHIKLLCIVEVLYCMYQYMWMYCTVLCVNVFECSWNKGDQTVCLSST